MASAAPGKRGHEAGDRQEDEKTHDPQKSRRSGSVRLHAKIA